MALGAGRRRASTRSATAWYPGRRCCLAARRSAVIAVAASGRSAPPPRAVVAAALCWPATPPGATSRSRGPSTQAVAWDGANRTAIYLLVLALFSLWPLDRAAPRIAARRARAGLAGLGLVELLKANAAAEPLGYFIDARFAEPAGYINANVALWTIGLFAVPRSGRGPGGDTPCCGRWPGRRGPARLPRAAGPEPRLGASRCRSRRCSSGVHPAPGTRAAIVAGSGDAGRRGVAGAAPGGARRVQRGGHRRAARRRHPARSWRWSPC